MHISPEARPQRAPGQSFYLPYFGIADHIGRARGSTQTATCALVFFYMSNGHTGRCLKAEDSYASFSYLQFDSAMGACILARTAAAASFLVHLRQHPLFFQIENHFAKGAKDLSRLPSLGPGMSDKTHVVLLPAPFCR